MKQLIGLNSNEFLLDCGDGGFRVGTELIFVCSEPVYRLEGAQIVKEQSTESFRIVFVGAKHLQGVAKDLAKAARFASKRETEINERLKPTANEEGETK